MATYYYEVESRNPMKGHGQFQADSDEEAKAMASPKTLVIYRESNSEDGLPFIIVYENDKLNPGYAKSN